MGHYSQNNEQEVILDFFGGVVGRFLDIGAFDGVQLSNTRALAELGWTGVMVEPNPHSLVKLLGSVKEFDGRVKVWSAAVSGYDCMTEIFFVEQKSGREWASGIIREEGRIVAPAELMVQTVGIRTLLQHGPFRFISIDAELMDFEILKDFPRENVCELLCVEPRDLDERKEMIEYLDKYLGFTVHHETHENIIARRK